MTEVCSVCGEVFDTTGKGRPPKYCLQCRSETRKKYHAARWLRVRPKVHRRFSAKVPGLLTVKGTRSQLEGLAGYHHSYKSMIERNRGGSGYSATLPSRIDKSPYTCRLKALRQQSQGNAVRFTPSELAEFRNIMNLRKMERGLSVETVYSEETNKTKGEKENGKT